ncbi:MAG: hypothetical protein AAF497_27790, partial [Planctomycetota bacterium]
MDSLTRYSSGVLQLLAVLTVLLAPWYLGGVTHLTHLITCVAGLVGLVLLLILVLTRRASLQIGFVEFIMLLALGLVVFQTASLPTYVLRRVSPTLTDLREQYTSVE